MEQPRLSETRSELSDRESGKWSAYQYAGRTVSAIPTASTFAGTEVSVDEIRSAAAASSNYYPPSLHGALVSSPEPYPPEQAIVAQGGYAGGYSGTRAEYRSMASVQCPSSSPLRLFVDKERNKVVMGEASGDFIDALLSFLTLPLGTIIRLRSAEVGCINNLYRSVQNLNTQVFWNVICKKILLCPRNPCEKLCQKLKFNVDDTEPTKYLMCASCRLRGDVSEKLLSTFAGASCSCGKLMEQKVTVDGEENNNLTGDGVFVRGEGMYLIFDDLTVIQNSAFNTIHQLVQLGYTDFTKLTEMSANVGLKQIMDLLKCALISTSSLTDVFLGREAGGSVSSFTPLLASQNVCSSGPSCNNLRIIVSKSKNKIMYAEAEEDFADFLFSFLSMPLGSTLKLLDGNVNLGSMHNLYKSVKGLNPSWFRRYRSKCPLFSPLLDLKVASQNGCKKQPLDVREEESLSFQNVKLFEPRCADGRRQAEGFVRRPSLFAVMDDLRVTPLMSTSIVSFLQRFQVPFNDLEEHKVTIHETEALNLLGASLTSKAALTNGLFYLVEKQKKEGLNLMCKNVVVLVETT
ncbi:hypothetical protein K1719_037916 [Acacia pycnantha]|nr:hypothetical protein K1719_037916 [Acacia pycnantha]